MFEFSDLSRLVSGAVRRQSGVVLVVALVFLLVMTLVGVTAMQVTSQQESMTSNMRQRNLAFQGAEASLRWGESGWGASGRGLAAATLPNFNASAANPGLRQPITAADIGAHEISEFWMDYYCWTARTGCPLTLPVQNDCPTLPELGETPLYVIEELPRVTLPGSSAKWAPLPDIGFYRVTARSVGGTTDAVVILQSVYRR